MTQPSQAKVQGKPLDLTDEALDQAATVTPVDVALAQSVWQQHAPKKLDDLLDAVVATDDA